MPELNQVFDKIGRPAVLRYRFGMIFPADGEQPDNVEGTIRHEAGPDVKVNKLYLLPQAVDLAQVDRVEYPVPEGVRSAPFGELVLNDREGCHTTFGRFGEEYSFGFGSRRFVFLRVNRVEDGGFAPLFIETQKDRAIFWWRFEVEWSGDTITVTLTEIDDEEELPPCLRVDVDDYI